MNLKANVERLTILDSIRVLAMVMVLNFHYYVSFKDLLGVDFQVPAFVTYGPLGLAFFFVVSGFVIAMTLERSSGFIDFIKRRFVRLIPTMLVCSLITFAFAVAFDTRELFPNAARIDNLLISNTFISPKLINFLFHTDFGYTDGVYWSLWVEVQFYFLAAFLFYASRKHFLRNIVGVSMVGLFFFYLSVSSLMKQLLAKINLDIDFKPFFNIFTYFENSLWICCGLLFYFLYKQPKDRVLQVVVTVFVITRLATLNDWIATFICTLFFILFYLIIYFPRVQTSLSPPIIVRLGQASYGVYLLHSVVGGILIYKFAPSLGPYSLVFPVLLVVGFSAIGIWSFHYVEIPLSRVLRRVFFRRNS